MIFSPDLSEIGISTSGYQESKFCHLLQGLLDLRFTSYPVDMYVGKVLDMAQLSHSWFAWTDSLT